MYQARARGAIRGVAPPNAVNHIIRRMLCSLTVLGALLLAQEHTPQNEKNPLAGQPAAIETGQRLFAQTCQACHGGNAAGSERGPALSTGVFRHGSKDGEIFLNIRNGIAGTQMPPFGRLSIDQSWQLVSYLRSLNAAGATVGEKVMGDSLQGEKLFFGKARCAGCHEVNGRGGIVGPDLSAAGGTPVDALMQKMVDPDTTSAPRGRRERRGGIGTTIVTLSDGRILRGVRRNEDTYSLQLADLSGRLHLIDKAQVRNRQDDPKSLMPSFAASLTAAERQDIVAYLKTHRERDLEETAKAPNVPGGLSYERIRHAKAEPQNWLTYLGRLLRSARDGARADHADERQESPKQVGRADAGRLHSAVDSVGGGRRHVHRRHAGHRLCARRQNRAADLEVYAQAEGGEHVSRVIASIAGVAVLGNRVYFGTLDAALVALDARTGRPLWETQVADTMEGYSITVSPLVVKDKIVVGVAGGEHGIRGFLDAYDAITGRRVWRFNTVPGPGEVGHDTWKTDSWKLGGAPTWLTGSYDPELDTLYWATGNPGPRHGWRDSKRRQPVFLLGDCA